MIPPELRWCRETKSPSARSRTHSEPPGKDGRRRLVSGTTGIGHTRWATHGAPNDINAHPHASNDGKFAVVHNGIIENYMELREELVRKGYRFESETDTEVIVHLIEMYYAGDFRKPS